MEFSNSAMPAKLEHNEFSTCGSYLQTSELHLSSFKLHTMIEVVLDLI